ncbi:hypothetical protein LCGC14_1799730 [marine sediment metagenome]|uniref:Uncharacterized protein n=1 Tax=marine sediment metagenome TaxID=412755 RepID=A0A0F9GPY8_9ZZZZ
MSNGETLGIPMYINDVRGHKNLEEFVSQLDECPECHTSHEGWNEDDEAETATECGLCGRDSYDPLNK